MPTRKRGQALLAPARAGQPKRDLGRVGRLICDKQHLVVGLADLDVGIPGAAAPGPPLDR
jgi:hypothetical protein